MYKEGDRVLIIGPEDRFNMSASEETIGWSEEGMRPFIGKIGKITSLNRFFYHEGISYSISLEDSLWDYSWHEDWFCPLFEEEIDSEVFRHE